MGVEVRHAHGLTGTAAIEASDASADDPTPSAGVRFARGNSAFGDVQRYSNAPPDAVIPAHSGLDTANEGQGMAHDNMQPSLVVRYIVALQGTFPSRS